MLEINTTDGMALTGGVAFFRRWGVVVEPARKLQFWKKIAMSTR